MTATVLVLGPQPGGAPMDILVHGHLADVTPEAGGASMALLTRRDTVLAVVHDHKRWGMGGVAPVTRQLRGCPITGAEMQSPYGGLLSMDDDPGRPEVDHRAARGLVAGLFTPAAAAAQLAADRAVIRRAVRRLRHRKTADLAVDLVEPAFARLICLSLGLPLGAYRVVKRASDVSFSPVHGTDLQPVVDGWDEIYAYYERLITARAVSRGTVAGIIAAAVAAGWSPWWISHLLANVSNGYPAAVQSALRVTWETLTGARAATSSCVAGVGRWEGLAVRLLNTRGLYALDVPRVLLDDEAVLDGRLFRFGDLVLPSLVGAALTAGYPDPPVNVAFSYGPHNCPGGPLVRQWLRLLLAEFYSAFPGAELDDDDVTWHGDALAAPSRILVRLGKWHG